MPAGTVHQVSIGDLQQRDPGESLIVSTIFHRVLTVGLFAAVALALFMFLVVGANNFYCPRLSAPASIEQQDNGIVVLRGSIDPSSAAKVIEMLQRPRIPITGLGLSSGGGNVDAANDIAQAINEIPNLRLLVPDAGLCQSACIRLLAASPSRLQITPTAQLMFHSFSRRSTMASSVLCQCVDTIVNLRLTILPVSSTRGMLDWAATLSPHLPELFEACERATGVNPLDTSQGITISGLEFNELRMGQRDVSSLLAHCPNG